MLDGVLTFTKPLVIAPISADAVGKPALTVKAPLSARQAPAASAAASAVIPVVVMEGRVNVTQGLSTVQLNVLDATAQVIIVSEHVTAPLVSVTDRLTANATDVATTLVVGKVVSKDIQVDVAVVKNTIEVKQALVTEKVISGIVQANRTDVVEMWSGTVTSDRVVSGKVTCNIASIQNAKIGGTLTANHTEANTTLVRSIVSGSIVANQSKIQVAAFSNATASNMDITSFIVLSKALVLGSLYGDKLIANVTMTSKAYIGANGTLPAGAAAGAAAAAGPALVVLGGSALQAVAATNVTTTTLKSTTVETKTLGEARPPAGRRAACGAAGAQRGACVPGRLPARVARPAAPTPRCCLLPGCRCRDGDRENGAVAPGHAAQPACCGGAGCAGQGSV